MCILWKYMQWIIPVRRVCCVRNKHNFPHPSYPHIGWLRKCWRTKTPVSSSQVRSSPRCQPCCRTSNAILLSNCWWLDCCWCEGRRHPKGAESPIHTPSFRISLRHIAKSKASSRRHEAVPANAQPQHHIHSVTALIAHTRMENY